jgi:ABC-2 type transport system permease protein
VGGLNGRRALAAFRFQLELLRSDRDYLLDLAVAPLFAVILLSIARHGGKAGVSGAVVLAPVLIAIWAMAVHVAGEIIDYDRWHGILEATVATPAPIPEIVFLRSLAVAGLSTIALLESWLVGRLGFGVSPVIRHPVAFAATMVATVFAGAGTSTLMSAVFVLSRGARIFQNTITYPFYVLGGVVVPVATLPGWARPLARLVFLSWSADLLRDSLKPAPVDALALRLGVIVLLGAVGGFAGRSAIEAVLGRLRRTGSLAHA